MQKKIFHKLIIFLLIISFNAKAIEIVGVPRIIDGDTIEINSKKIRLFGIDAPESKQKCKKKYLSIFFFKLQKDYKCGIYATKKLSNYIKQNTIKCISNQKDRYSRHLSICYLKNKDINKWLVRQGLAVAYRRYSKKYLSDENYAKENSLGIWQGTFIRPDKWRRNN